MRGKWTLLMAIGAAFLGTAATAAVTNTHHDMAVFRSQTVKEVCWYCHGAVDTSAVTGYGQVGALCLTRCHAGDAGANYSGTNATQPARAAFTQDGGTVNAMADDYTVVKNGHKFTIANLRNRVGGALGALVSGGALPYTGTGRTTIECTSCHNVHDNTKAPFLWGDMMSDTGGAGTNVSFCQRCHDTTNEQRGNNWAGGETAPNGEHPVNFALILGTVTATNRTLGGRVGRYIQFDGRSFDVTSYYLPADLNQIGNHYTVGGKVSTWDIVTSGSPRFGCYTCHVTHLDVTNNLVARNDYAIDAPAAGNAWNPMCVSCHGAAATNALNINEQNPGLTAWTHPVASASNAGTLTTGNTYNYTNSNGTFPFTVDLAPVVNFANANGKNGVVIQSANGRILCTSCHDVHGGVAGSMAIADLDGTSDGTATAPVCYACHTGSGIVDLPDDQGKALANAEAANSHHRTRIAGITTPATFTDADGNTLNMDTPSWIGAPQSNPTLDDTASYKTFGSLTNGLSCPDCHVFNGTGHNW